jgi:shikimate dehydrogenase
MFGCLKVEILGTTKVCAAIGDPIEHSFSPQIHNAAFQHLKLNYTYVAFRVPEKNLKDALTGIRALGIHGLNVTMPLKRSIIPYLDELDANAKGIGAVNTVLNRKGKLIGYNTDGLGALSTLKANDCYVGNKKILILGAGGASRAISYTLAKDTREIAVLNRTIERARELARDINRTFGEKTQHGRLDEETLEKELKDTDILINATPIGMHPYEDQTPVNRNFLRSDLTVFDLVYNPPETRLLREAKTIGAKTVNGIVMLVHQGAASFEIWTGRKASIDVMLRACAKGIEDWKKSDE